MHTWSLSIEEQFYLLWPLLFVFFLKRKKRLLLVLILGGVIGFSLFANYCFQDGHVKAISKLSAYIGKLISDGRSTIFYLLPFRLYEFAIGGGLVFVANRSNKSAFVNEIIIMLGMVMIGYSVFMFSEQTIFPSHNALIPCLGAALLIYGGNKSNYFGKLLSNKIAIGIGLVSYSLYLVHWPIIVFWKYYTFKNTRFSKILQ